MKKNIEVRREYVFTQKELKKLLGIRGNINSILGYSVAIDDTSEKDKNSWEFSTIETLKPKKLLQEICDHPTTFDAICISCGFEYEGGFEK